MNASELKAICRWLITIFLAASLAQKTVTLLNDPSFDQPSPVVGPILPAAPQEGHGN